ncbi:MAG TPA: ABC transporter permease [Gemmatimonadaceae bacterium]|nr:ABC transporter permease [Gemmatimonadaceae bacterium]
MMSALRSCRRTPGFSALCTLSMAISLGFAAATFAVIDSVLYPYIPYPASDRLIRVIQWGDGINGRATAADKYHALQAGANAFSDIAAMAWSDGFVESGGQGESQWVARVTPTYFRTVGVAPGLGRVLTGNPASDEGTAVVSYSLWQRWFAGRGELRGAMITVDDRAYAIVGVLPPAAMGPDVYVPLPPGDESVQPWASRLMPVVRLKPGFDPEKANAELRVIATRLEERFGTGRRPFSYSLQPFAQPSRSIRSAHVILAAAGFVVLLVACANVATLTLVRSMSRSREYALRMALGATPATLIRLQLAETGALVLIGGVAGLGLAAWGTRLAVGLLPAGDISVGALPPHLTWHVVLWTALAAALSAVAAGLLPAWRATRIVVAEPLKNGSATTSQPTPRFNTAAVISVALTMTLLMATGLLLEAMRHVGGYQFGFDTNRLLSGWVDLGRDTTGRARHASEMLGRVAASSGVGAATMIGYMQSGDGVVQSTAAGDATRTEIWRTYYATDPYALRTLGVPVIAGRDFLMGDAAGAGAVILSSRAARALFPHGGAVGGFVRFGNESTRATWLPVVGIARDITLGFSRDPDEIPDPVIFAVSPEASTRYRQLIVRVTGTPVSTALAVHRSISGHVKPWSTYYRNSLADQERLAGLFGTLSALALFLTAFGVYSIIAYTVSQRRREFAIRLALGAAPPSIVRRVFHDATVTVLAGTASGAFASLYVMKLLTAYLYDVRPTDARVLVAAECVLIVVSLLAALGPAITAMRAEPLEVLRAT